MGKYYHSKTDPVGYDKNYGSQYTYGLIRDENTTSYPGYTDLGGSWLKMDSAPSIYRMLRSQASFFWVLRL